MVNSRVELVDNELRAEDFIRLKREAGFQDAPVNQVEKALKNGLFHVSAVCDGKVVGMGRLVGDGAMYWYLQEIVVSPEYQGRGIGRQIVGRLLDYVRQNSIPGTRVTVGLSAAKGKAGFYEKFGFVSRPNDACDPGMEKKLEIPDTRQMEDEGVV